MPVITKAEQKQAQAAEDSFNRTSAAQYGASRWQTSLYPALSRPTRYSCLVNRYAIDSVDSLLTREEKDVLDPIEFPVITNDSSAEDSQDAKTKNKTMTCYQFSVSGERVFPMPQPAVTAESGKRLMTHWNLDAASLLAVNVLDARPGDAILDLCAAPGGKSVAIAQVLAANNRAELSCWPDEGCLHCNEVDSTRNKRLAVNLQSYLPASLFKSRQVQLLRFDGAESNAASHLPLGEGGYDKVLVDAPCSSERHIIHAHLKAKQSGRPGADMMSWRAGHSKRLAKTQAALLMTALKAAKINGRVVYATCSLSNEENDGVIEKVLELVQKEARKGALRWRIDLHGQELDSKGMGSWAERTRHGWIVLPDHPGGQGWGPLFFAVIDKREKM